MKGKKIITILVIINILFIGIIYNLININYFKNNKQIVKHMTETGNESQIEELNKSYQNYREYIDSSKKQLATAITNKGVTTTSDSSLETMTANVNKIVTNPPASLISYDNTTSKLSATNVQDVIDEIDNSLNIEPVTMWPYDTSEISEYVGYYYPKLKLMHIRYLFSPKQDYPAGFDLSTFSVRVSNNQLIHLKVWNSADNGYFLRHTTDGFLRSDTDITASGAKYFVDYWIETQ